MFIFLQSFLDLTPELKTSTFLCVMSDICHYSQLMNTYIHLSLMFKVINLLDKGLPAVSKISKRESIILQNHLNHNVGDSQGFMCQIFCIKLFDKKIIVCSFIIFC